MSQKKLNIKNYYIYSFLTPSEKSIQTLNRCFKNKSFFSDKIFIDLYLCRRTLNKKKYKSKFSLYFSETMSILIDKKIKDIRTISRPTLVTLDEKKYDKRYNSEEYTDFYDSLLLAGDIPIKYIKGIIIPIEKYIEDPFLYSLFVGKNDFTTYLNGVYTKHEIKSMRTSLKENYSKEEIKKYLDGYISSLDRMMMDNDVYIPQLKYSVEDTKILLLR